VFILCGMDKSILQESWREFLMAPADQQYILGYNATRAYNL
jgi:hypothetical protein